MTSTPEQQPADRLDAAAINDRIRALWVGDTLPVERREEYARLLVAWEAAVRAEQELAA
ncbi:hypothetical protein [Streptomyces sp. NPDC058664]|uniref:hypothetical protein n=1 Tax=unclassified Streptomyces TaxID=2593676 RepID=UPI003651B1DF